MFFTVEPMINVGKPDAILDKSDGWTVRLNLAKMTASLLSCKKLLVYTLIRKAF